MPLGGGLVSGGDRCSGLVAISLGVDRFVQLALHGFVVALLVLVLALIVLVLALLVVVDPSR